MDIRMVNNIRYGKGKRKKKIKGILPENSTTIEKCYNKQKFTKQYELSISILPNELMFYIIEYLTLMEKIRLRSAFLLNRRLYPVCFTSILNTRNIISSHIQCFGKPYPSVQLCNTARSQQQLVRIKNKIKEGCFKCGYNKSYKPKWKTHAKYNMCMKCCVKEFDIDAKEKGFFFINKPNIDSNEHDIRFLETPIVSIRKKGYPIYSVYMRKGVYFWTMHIDDCINVYRDFIKDGQLGSAYTSFLNRIKAAKNF